MARGLRCRLPETLGVPVALDSVVVRVGALALGAVATAAQGGVVAPGRALEAPAGLARHTGVGAVAAAHHNKLLVESGGEKT